VDTDATIAIHFDIPRGASHTFSNVPTGITLCLFVDAEDDFGDWINLFSPPFILSDGGSRTIIFDGDRLFFQ
jgi:hypothetical protein